MSDSNKTGTVLQIDRLGLRYPNGKQALSDVSLSVAAGELVVVLGSNGCGKSSMLRCIVRLIAPTSGHIAVAGRSLDDLSQTALCDARRDIAMVGQTAHLVRRRSVIANVMSGTLARHRTLATRLGRLPQSETGHAGDCLSRVGLDDLAGQRAGTLSGGQAQRVAIARALAQRPRLVLADEPVASLDPEAAHEVMRLLRALADDGLAVLCVLHQPALASRYADRVVGLRAGRTVFEAAARSVPTEQIERLYGSYSEAA